MVGAGPTSLFAAIQLAKDFEITILEETSHVGGSGLWSDGKLNFHPMIGGDLTDFVSTEEAWSIINKIRKEFASLGVDVGGHNEAGIQQLEADAAKAGIKFVLIYN